MSWSLQERVEIWQFYWHLSHLRDWYMRRRWMQKIDTPIPAPKFRQTVTQSNIEIRSHRRTSHLFTIKETSARNEWRPQTTMVFFTKHSSPLLPFISRFLGPRFHQGTKIFIAWNRLDKREKEPNLKLFALVVTICFLHLRHCLFEQFDPLFDLNQHFFIDDYQQFMPTYSKTTTAMIHRYGSVESVSKIKAFHFNRYFKYVILQVKKN